MTRGLTQGQIDAVVAPVVRAALLIEFDFAPEPMRVWTGLGEITWGNRTFAGTGDLLAVSGFSETVEVSAQGINFTLSGIPGDVIAEAMNVTWQGRAARVWVALFTATHTANSLISDPVPVFAGRMDTMQWTESETATITLAAESRLIDLGRAPNRRYTSADQEAEFPGDLVFSFVASLQEREIEWGRT